MSDLLAIGLTNAALATGLAFLAWGVTRIWRNPRGARWLWLIVLAKLVSPPIVAFDLSPMVAWRADAARTVASPGDEDERGRGSAMSPLSTKELPSVEFSEASDDGLLSGGTSTGGTSTAPSILPAETAARWDWAVVLLAVWGGGAIAYVVIAASRIWRFHRLIGRMETAPAALQHELGKLLTTARRMNQGRPLGAWLWGRLADIPAVFVRHSSITVRLGLRVQPQLKLIDGRMGPLMWPLGCAPTIVLPRRLLEVLSAEQLRGVLCHELAHWLRRDHWVRWFELAVGVAYWWHPVTWWARRELQAAEELCCDAMVLHAPFHAPARPYAEALLAAGEFAAGLLESVPAVVTSMGSTSLLQRRIAMIVQNRLPRGLSRRSRVGLVCLTTAALGLSTNLAKTDSPDGQASKDVAGETDAVPAPAAPTEPAVPENEVALLQPGSLLHIEATGILPGQPIKGVYIVESSGAVNFGPTYGRVMMIGKKTVKEAEAQILKRLRQVLANPAVMATTQVNGELLVPVPVPQHPYQIKPGDVLFINAAGMLPDQPPIAGLFAVEPSGEVALGPVYGRVMIQGKTLEEAEQVIQASLSRILKEPLVAVTHGEWLVYLRGREAKRQPKWFGSISPEELLSQGATVEALRAHIDSLTARAAKVEALYRMGRKGGDAANLLLVQYQLARARAELALAEGRPADALKLSEEAVRLATERIKAANVVYNEDLVSLDEVLKADADLLEAKLHLGRMRWRPKDEKAEAVK